ncbi:MAG: flagellin [Oryzomonas sp.]|uniref:flagellin N-terminal helical domain-containing protein n=1 Tax=Oryzomonas sp. TaxID=2855186 RepID=UPI00284F2178|nr:flagellin [Oryzomonas sp.]MDR3579530.1 flagellin [Oryzomonas sp.]
MSIDSISLTSGMRNNLISLQQISSEVNTTQGRLSSGKKVNSALDNPTTYFASQSELQRANDLSNRQDGMSEAVQTIQAANAGISSITSLIQSAQGLASSAASTSDTASQATYYSQFLQLQTQITQMASDSGYQGTNLLTAGTLTIQFGQATGSSSLTVNGFAADNTGLGVTTVGSWTTAGNAQSDSAFMDAAITTLRSQSSSLASNLGVITTRQSFTTSLINTLQTGSDNLTLADMNEESANMLALQTKQSLGTTALSLSSQAAQSVLKLF